MTKAEQFAQCWERARRIVERYRAEAPEGCDPQNTYIAAGAALTGALVGTAGTVYASSQQSKAAKAQASALKEGTRELEPVLLGDPAQIDTRAVNLRGIDQVYDLIPYARKLSDNINSYNYSRALQYYRRIQPMFDSLQRQIGRNAMDFAQGRIPDDVAAEVGRRAAERGIQGGFGMGSQGGRTGALANLNLRNLGLTSLDLSRFGTQLAMNVNASAKALLPNLISPIELFLNPGQQLQAEATNVGAKNEFAIRNNATLNNAAQQNTSLQNSLNQTTAGLNYNAALGDAQMIAQAAQALGGVIGSTGQLLGSRGTPAPIQTSGAGAVNYLGQPVNRAPAGGINYLGQPLA